MFFETMESRKMLSVSPTAALRETLQQDQAQVQAALEQFQSDAVCYTKTILGDIAKLKADGATSDAALMHTFQKFHADVESMWAELKTARINQYEAVSQDQSAVCAELVQILQDKGNPTAEHADREQLLADRVQLEQDAVAGLNARLTIRENAYGTLFSDLSAIDSEVQSDPNASSQLQADVQQFVTDRGDCLTAMAHDIHDVIVARTQLITDLTAMESVV
jgi:hypothetical protein